MDVACTISKRTRSRRNKQLFSFYSNGPNNRLHSKRSRVLQEAVYENWTEFDDRDYTIYGISHHVGYAARDRVRMVAVRADHDTFFDVYLFNIGLR